MGGVGVTSPIGPASISAGAKLFVSSLFVLHGPRAGGDFWLSLQILPIVYLYFSRLSTTLSPSLFFSLPRSVSPCLTSISPSLSWPPPPPQQDTLFVAVEPPPTTPTHVSHRLITHPHPKR
ncbi:hypothetical protein LY78DRAFT_655816 [Colletotrichum sublineola]|nr:hypothetical protein LY78DRAFT_655816 [Colletotrichum sublineola]